MKTLHAGDSSRTGIASLVVMLITILVGCETGPIDDPASAMLERNLTVHERLTIMDQAATEAADEPAFRENLKLILSRPGYSAEARIRAFEMLYDLDPEDARTTLLYRFPTLPSFDFVAYACDRIAAEGWQEFTPALIRSLSQPVGNLPMVKRPDYQALAALHPGRSVESVLFEFIATLITDPVLNQWQMTAYELLNEMNPDGTWRQGLETRSGECTPFLLDAQAAWNELGVMPRTREEIRWVEYLREPDQAEIWTDYATLSAGIPLSRRVGLRLRHLPILAAARDLRPELLRMSGDHLYGRLESELESAAIYPRTGRGSPETLAEWKPGLCWGDLVALNLARDLMKSSAARALILQEWDADQKDATTEYGGLIRAKSDGWLIVPFAPTQRRHDQKFYAPEAMITAGYTAPFHYHFHVQKVRNRAYAGPGVGDLQYADSMAINSLVFTSLNRTQLNVDYYTENGMVVDLGVLE